MGFPSRPCRREARPPRSKEDRKRKSWLRRGAPYNIDERPSFGQWLRFTVVDILTMAVLGVIALVVFHAGPAATRTFPLTVTTTGEVIYPQFAYPYRPQFVPAWLATVLAAAVPIVIILAAQVRIRSFWDVNNAVIGLIYALEGSAVFQVIIKWLIGGLRPHFYDVCRPDPSLASRQTPDFNATGLNAVGYAGSMFTREVCTSGNRQGIDNALQSFPSGHSTTAFAGFVYLALYLNAKLKVFGDHQPAFWKLALAYCPVLAACLIGGSLTVDESHNWYDVLAGAAIGTLFAFSAYRMVYAAVWDYRVNHIPLTRGTAFATGPRRARPDLVFTRRAGWGAAAVAETAREDARGATHTEGGEGLGLGPNGAPGLRHPQVTIPGQKGPRGDDLV